jgi:hypothetical protein
MNSVPIQNSFDAEFNILCFGLKEIPFKQVCIIEFKNITQVFDVDLRWHFP